MSEFAAEYGVSDAVDGDGWGWIAGRKNIGPSAPGASTEPVRRRPEGVPFERIIEEIPHLQRYAGFLTRDATEKDDLVQDCLERALSRMGQFRPETDLRRWLFVILRNLFIDGKRKEARRRRQLPMIDQDCLIVLSPQLSHLRLKEVEAAIRRLRPFEQEIIFLSVFLGVRHEIIADHMQVSVGTVKSRLARARDKLRQETERGSNSGAGERAGQPHILRAPL